MNDSNNSKEPDIKFGKGMMTIAWIIAFAFLTWFFIGVEKRQNNPNYSPNSSSTLNSVQVELKQNRWGHYVTNGEVDGKVVVFLLDTGATNIAIPGSLEKHLNLKRGQSYQVSTANGNAVVYATKINSIKIGEIVLTNVRASISPSMLGDEILLGMTALKQVELRQKGKVLTLIQER